VKLKKIRVYKKKLKNKFFLKKKKKETKKVLKKKDKINFSIRIIL